MAKSVDEIRNELVNLGYNLEDLKGKSKSELREMLESASSADQALSEVIPNTDIPILNLDEKPTLFGDEELKPKPTDSNWTEYVLGLLDKKELENGMPRTDGLRRVAELLLGRFNIQTQVIQVPNIENAGRATVVTTLTFRDKETKESCTYQGAADVFSGNTDRDFAVHAVATAETRSEGRALRKALRLVKVLAAEEKCNAGPDEPNGTDQRIPTGMLNSLRIMCDRDKIDLVKLAVYLGYNIAVPEDLTQPQGLAISNELSLIKQGKKPLVDVIKA